MKKLLTLAGLLFLVNFITKGLLIKHVPNSLSFQEVGVLQFFKIFPNINDFSSRLVNTFVSSCIISLLFILISKRSKNFTLGLIVSTAVSLAPWFIILSGYLNPYLIPILFIILLLNFLPNKIGVFFAAFLFLISFRFLIVSHDILSIRFSLIIPALIKLFDLRTLFFQGDPSSPMLRVPLTGYFFYIDLIAFFSGVYYLFFINKITSLKKDVNIVLFLGLLFFFILPSELLMTQRGELVFLWMSIVIGFGYYYFFYTFKKINILLLFGFVFIIFMNFMFTFELLLNHFDKKNSSEWNYAEQTAVKYFVENQDIPVYMTNQSDKLYRYWNFYKQKGMNVFVVTLDEMKKACIDPKVICVAKEEELSFFNIEKDDSKQKFGNYDGLPMYFVLPSQ